MASKWYDPLLFGQAGVEGVVAVQPVAREADGDEVDVFIRNGAGLERVRRPFRPFIVAERRTAEACPGGVETVALAGGRRLDTLVTFPTWKAFLAARRRMAAASGATPTAPDAPFFAPNDPVHQYLLASGTTHFLGLDFEDLRRVQVDIECATADGFDFCNPEREEDRIVAIALAGPGDEVEVLSGAEMDEEELLKAFVAAIGRLDPDVIEGHNLFNFDLPYIAARARRHGVKLTLGRDGSRPARRPGRFTVGERTIAYERFDIYGRHVVDTLHLAQYYDVAHRSLDGFGLKEVAIHLGVAAPNRTYLDGRTIGQRFRDDPATVLKYVHDDAVETRAVASLLERGLFLQARMLPFSYQTTCVRGVAARIDALIIREYLRRGESLPVPEPARSFEGGYTDMFVRGVVRNVHHVDVRSLYPSLMLARGLAPERDACGVFLALLARLREDRLDAKRRMRAARTDRERLHYDALQSAFKLLINAFYGYLGFAQARFNDFAAAERVAAGGRELLKSMIEWLRAHEACPIEIDTDGIYFVPPPGLEPVAMERFREDFSASLPDGIEVEFDGEYRAMFSYRMKNYALLAENGEMAVKGAALKSRGLEPFQREFLRRLIRLKLEERESEIPAVKAEVECAIREHRIPLEDLAKTETLRDSPAAYQAGREKRKSPRRAAYELALASGRPYRAGDRVTYYVAGGGGRSGPVYASARLLADADPNNRDEDEAYYLDKLEILYTRFMSEDGGTDDAAVSEGEDAI